MLVQYWMGVTKASVGACFVWGVGLTVANMLSGMFCGKPFMNPIDCGAAAMLGGFIVAPVVSLVSPKLAKDYVADIFTCYKK